MLVGGSMNKCYASVSVDDARTKVQDVRCAYPLDNQLGRRIAARQPSSEAGSEPARWLSDSKLLIVLIGGVAGVVGSAALAEWWCRV